MADYRECKKCGFKQIMKGKFNRVLVWTHCPECKTLNFVLIENR